MNIEQDTMSLPVRPRQSERQTSAHHAAQPDYDMMKTLAELSGLRFLVVYRLLRGQQVSDANAWVRLLNARLELQRQEQVQRLREQFFHE